MKRSLEFGIFLTLAALLALPALGRTPQARRSYEPDGLGTLAGTVVGPNGAPLPGVRVTVQDASGVHPHAVETNDQGRFFFPQLKPGLYDARAYSNGVWSEWEHNINVHKGKQTEVKLKIPKRKASSKKAAHLSAAPPRTN